MESWHPKAWRTPRPGAIALMGLVALLLAGVMGIGGYTLARAQDPATYVVRAGDGEPGFSVDLFLPDSVTIMTGDTVQWNFPWLEPHTVTMGPVTGNPAAPTHPGEEVVDFDGTNFISSGLVLGGAQLKVRFTTPGTFEYFCLIHPFMTGTVTVVDGGTVDTQEAIDSRGGAAYTDALAGLKALAAEAGAKEVAVEGKPDGTKRYTVTVAPANLDGVVMQYFPATLNINEGDTIRWVNDTPVPHTATFGPPPNVIPDPEDPAIHDPATPAETYDGTGFWNSGVIGVDWDNGTSFEMTFSKAGSYQYYCLLHEPQGQRGTVNVAAAAQEPTPTPVPPKTGTGLTASDDAGGAWLPLFAAGLVVLAAGAGAMAFAVRRSR